MTDNGNYATLSPVLDLFSGTGSATLPFVECGKHQVVHVDVEAPAELRCDVRQLPRWVTEVKWAFVWMSSPCDDFTDVPWHSDLRNPERGLELWNAGMKVASRTLYIAENVRGAQRYLGPATTHAGSRYLWTNLKLGPLPKVYGKWRLPPTPDRKMLRSMIPRPLGDAIHERFHHVA